MPVPHLLNDVDNFALTPYTPLGYHDKVGFQHKTKAIRRLRRIGGQIRGLERMVEKNKYCIDILTQSLAVKEALSSFEDFILERHLESHVAEQMKSDKKAKAVKEILSIYKLSKRK